MPSPGRLTPGKGTVRLGGHQGRSGRVRKSSSLPGFDHRTAQPVAMVHTFLHLYGFRHAYVYCKDREMRPKHLSYNLKEKDDLGDIKADGREIFIRINLREVECKAVDSSQQASDTIQLGDFVKTEMKLPVL